MHPFDRPLSDYARIAVIGAGGKTSICRALTGGLPGTCVYATTTHMFRPEEDLICLEMPSPSALEQALARHKKVALCGPESKPGSGKTTFPGDALYQTACRLADHVILEADGARGRHIKLHGENEPVIPENVELVLAVASLEALGRPLGAVVHREERIERVFQKGPEEPVTEAEIALALALACKFHPNTLPVLNRVQDEGAAERVSALLRDRFSLPCLCLNRFGNGVGNGTFLECQHVGGIFLGLEAGFQKGYQNAGHQAAGEAPVV